MQIEGKSQRAVSILEKIVLGAGSLASCLNLFLVLIIVVQVTCRYFFGRGYIFLEELQWHLYSAAFLIGLSYAVTKDVNVRMNLLFVTYRPKTREWIDVIGIIFLTFPFVIVIFLHSLDFVKVSWVFGERSEAPFGLPYRWAIKAVIPISCVLLAIAGVARVMRAFSVIFGERTGGSR